MESNLIESIQFAFERTLGFTPSEQTVIEIILNLDQKGWEFIYTREDLPYANDNYKEK